MPVEVRHGALTEARIQSGGLNTKPGGRSHADLQAEVAGRASDSRQQRTSTNVPAGAAELRDVARMQSGAQSIISDHQRNYGSGQSRAREAAPHVQAEAKPERVSWWRRAFRGTKSAVAGAAEFVGTVANGVAELGSIVAEVVAEQAPKLLTKELWSDVGEGLSALGDKLTDKNTWTAAGKLWVAGMTLGPKALVHLITNPVESLQTAGRFLKGVSDSMGITDLVTGIGKLCTGDLEGGLQAIKGAGTLFLEVTGIADLGRALKHGGLALYSLGKGDRAAALAHMGQAVMHGAFAAMSIGAIAATVATGGAAVGAVVGVALLRTSLKQGVKQVVTTAAKEFFKKGGAQLGKELVEQVSKDLSTEVLEKTAQESVTKGTSTALREVLGERGAKQLLDPGTPAHVKAQLMDSLDRGLTPEVFESVFKDVGRESTEKLMKEAGVAKHAEELAYELLRDAGRWRPNALINRFERAGMSPDQARQAAKETRRALSKYEHGSFFSEHTTGNKELWQRDFDAWATAGTQKRAVADRQIVDALTESMKKPLAERIAKEQQAVFSREFRRVLKGEGDTPISKALGEVTERQAQRLGKSVDDVVEQHTEAAWKGYRQGIEEAVEKAVREGVESAMKKFRAKKLNFNVSGPTKSAYESTLTDGVVVGGVTAQATGSDSPSIETENSADTAQRTVSTSRIRREGGRVIKDTLEMRAGEERWILVGSSEIEGISQDGQVEKRDQPLVAKLFDNVGPESGERLGSLEMSEQETFGQIAQNIRNAFERDDFMSCIDSARGSDVSEMLRDYRSVTRSLSHGEALGHSVEDIQSIAKISLAQSLMDFCCQNKSPVELSASDAQIVKGAIDELARHRKGVAVA